MNQGVFQDSVLRQIRRDSDIVGLASQYVSLKKSGQNFTGLCPFHTEKTPSFVVSPSKQIYHCFGCHAGGDTLTFMMKMEGQSFPEAVRNLAERLGIKIAFEKGATGKDQEDRSWLYKLHEGATEFFSHVLLKTPQGKPARDYLSHRGIRPETIEAFRLGFAPPSWDSLQGALSKSGWSPEKIAQAGLIIPRGNQGTAPKGFYDRFRNRLIFPIVNLQGNVCGFGGRVLDNKDVPKYLNSPETSIFNKGKLLFGLEKARETAHQAGCLVIVEGYFDAIVAHQAGIKNVVATLGTSLTESHLHLAKRFTQKVKLIFDSDDAGIRASLRSVDLINATDLSADVVQLPKGEDPDSFLTRYGKDPFLDLLNRSQRLMDFAVENSLTDPEAHSIEGKLRIVRQLLPTIQQLKHPIERGHYIKKLAEGLQINEQDLLAESRVQKPLRPWRGTSPTSTRGTNPAKMTPVRLPKEEEILIHFLLHQQISTPPVLDAIQPDDFSDVQSRQIVESLLNSYKLSETPQLDEILEQRALRPEWASFLRGLSVREPDYENRSQTIADCLRALKIKKFKNGMRDLQSQIQLAEQEGKSEVVRGLQSQLLGLKRKSVEVGGSFTLRHTG